MELSEQEKKLFSQTKSTGDRAPNLRHGKYLLMIDRWTLHRGYRNVLSDIHNFIVLKAEKLVVYEGDKRREDEPNEVLSRASCAFKHDGRSMEMARINSMRFLLSLLGITDSQLTEEEKIEYWIRLTNDDPKKFQNEKLDNVVIPSVNPTRGMVLGCETNAVLTRESKQWIVGATFLHIASPGQGENSYENAARRWLEYENRLKEVAA